MSNPKEISEKEEIFDIRDEQKSHLIDIINVLETEFLPINEKVIKKQMIEHINLFGKNWFHLVKRIRFHSSQITERKFVLMLIILRLTI